MTYATKKRTKEVQEAGAHELLLKMLRNNADKPTVVSRCLDAFAEMSDQDADLAKFSAIRVPSAIDVRKW